MQYFFKEQISDTLLHYILNIYDSLSCFYLKKKEKKILAVELQNRTANRDVLLSDTACVHRSSSVRETMTVLSRSVKSDQQRSGVMLIILAKPIIVSQSV